jgi:two-component system phosphate regulon sensor histidine kinase PhoR
VPSALHLTCILSLVAVAVAAIVVALRHRREVDERREITRFATGVSSGSLDETLDAWSLSPRFRELARAIEDLRRLRVEHQESSRRQTEVLFDVVGGLREGVIVIDSRRRLSLVNQRAAELFDLDSSATGRASFETIRYSAILDGLNAALRGEQSQHSIVVRRGAESRTVDCRIFPLGRSPEAAAVAIFDDVTRVEKLEAIRRNFISDFLHEVRTPLTGMRSSVEILEGGGSSPEQEQQLRKIALRQLVRLEQLVRDLTELNTIETGELRLNREPTDLRLLAGDVVEDLGELLAATGVAAEVEGEGVVADVDPIRVHQILTNLVENAARHSNSPRVVIALDRDDRDAIVRVRDFGIGIPAEEQEKIFHRFHRVDKSRSQRVPGSGLGLAIAKHLVIQHGGAIGVESVEGEGSTFELRFPRR